MAKDTSVKNMETEKEMDQHEADIRVRIKKKNAERRRKKIIIWLVIILAIASYLFYSQSQAKKKMEQQVAATAPRDGQVYSSVITTTIDLSGYVEPYDTQKVNMRATGTVTTIAVEEGDAVKEGDLLAALDDTTQQYALANINVNIEKAELQGSVRDVELLKLQKITAENNLDYTRAYANFDGVVASVDIEVGNYFEAGASAMTIIDRSRLKASVEVDEIDMQYVFIGQKAYLTFDSLPGQVIEAEVSYIPMLGRYSSQGIGVVDVELTIYDPPASLVPGFTFEGTIEVEGDTELVLIPQAAITTTRGNSTVQKKLPNGTYETVPVTIKYLGEGVSQLLNGDLMPGDTILLKNTSNNSLFGSFGVGGDGGGGGGGGAPMRF
ncbi:efflux RND transporter periplasmic adaptor subunit [Parasphaerochaeta coccoides]|uniref:Efflux transporter, RND family, MFP subunit n=1 Tax=Parasphaerochaeta coccoides (strain ATCC BAA-1237 / DSM 17374 / SPN1) TaxID=760011 RepID=F4GHH3_PARC1|nr:efflux RND transporter periplasmic adaptor subunit [Parasphaerochaeta coccoides]AEC02562.1 efflux transporter, RND family, MFP subunit [Parasphaerochaeta coccoides DSM 17374]